MNTSEYINESMSRYIHLSKYSRWLPKQKRRETWEETCDRLIKFWEGRYAYILDAEVFVELRQSLVERKAMPSMRTLMTAGPALDRDEAAGFNCAGAGISHIRYFDEVFYLLMCGTGVGFSVEHKYVDQLPVISEDFHKTDTVIRVRDSKIGWAKGLKELIALLYNGDIPTWDLSEVRPAGARLKTFGGRASGPEPLDKLFHKVVEIITKAAGRRLSPIECHDLVCWIAMTVIVGSVRRSACISLSDLWEHAMRKCKMGDWYYIDPQRALANNSAAYYGRPPVDQFAKEFMSMYTSRSGERGIVNKNALRDQAESCGREYDGDYLLNP
jgi:ribonucleoside-triphosphate reductase (thioredoxin)